MQSRILAASVLAQDEVPAKRRSSSRAKPRKAKGIRMEPLTFKGKKG